MNPQSDRNFLFVLIAYQNGYITMEQFFEAATAWNKEPKRDISEILVEKNYIEEVERYNIQGIVEDRIRRQGGLDNTLSFALENGSVPDGPQLPEDWNKQISKAIDKKTTPKPPNLQSTESNSGINRYIIRKTIGHGGQGYVWEAIDTELNRKVAIKNVHPNLSDDPIHQELLMDEARKTGKLGHPGVPPVFDIGKDNDGKPFFTMQLISGEKLSDRYGDLQYDSISRSDYVNQIRPVLRHLIAACNTVQYAFDNEDVIHRDLKPGNIMVNKYGETVVMDWGMGKIVSDPSEIKDASSVLLIPLPQGSGSMGRTSVGTIKGSVMFMSPEQARAENDRLDHRTDVYGLGATLYWILTGKPPHKGSRESLPEIQRNQFPSPRQALPSLGIPRELEAICLKAMATKPEDRYQKAGQMAADLENFIAGEPVSALPENFLRKTERFLRKHARAVVASLLALTLAVIGLSLANWIISAQNKTIVLEAKRTKESRAVASNVIESLVGFLVDNGLSQIPGANELRLEILEAIAEEIEEYLQNNPDDTELKLDLARLLTRLAKLEQEQQTEEMTLKARKHWQRSEEILQETKNTPDQTFQINWKKTFCDRAYYYVDLLLKDGDTKQAEAILQEGFSHAQDVMKIPEEQSSFALAHARLFRRLGEIHETSELWTEAFECNQKAKNILQPFVDPYLTPTQAQVPSEAMIEEQDLDVGILGNFILLCGDQADYETLQKKYNEAEQSALLALKACGLAPRVVSAKRDGIVQSGTNYRRLQRIAWMQQDAAKAEKYYADWVAFFGQNQEEPLLQRPRFYILSDRARSLAKSDLQKASAALEESIMVFEGIKNSEDDALRSLRSPRPLTEMEYCIAAAKMAIAKAQGRTDEIQALSDDKQRHQERLKELNASPSELKELEFLP